MAWTNVECSECGETYRVQMYGPIKTRQWKVDNWRGICGECKERKHQELLEENKSGEYPELVGSEKQIAWAVKIRKQQAAFLENIADEKIINDVRSNDKLEIDSPLVQAAIADVFQETSAHWWIENRSFFMDCVFKKVRELYQENRADPEDEYLQEQVEAESLLRPADPVSETIATIDLFDHHIEISFMEKNDDFKTVVKNHVYRWDFPWKKSLSFRTGDPLDRVAEIGHALLANGFCVRIINPDIRQKIADESFSIEQTRWVASLAKEGKKKFYITWAYQDDLYREAKKIIGSRYEKPGVTVPSEHFEEVLDFAEIHGFELSPGAHALVEHARQTRESALEVEVSEKEPSPLPEKPSMVVPDRVEVPDDLKD